MEKICPNCQVQFTHQTKKLCSRTCADKFKKKNSRETRTCAECHNLFETRKKDTKMLCSNICRTTWSARPENITSRIQASQNAIIEKYGIDNVFKMEDIQKLALQRKKELYGDEKYNNIEKMKKTRIERYGSMGYFNAEKTCKTNIERFGTSHPMQNVEIQNKMKITNLEKYGTENVSSNKEIQSKKKQTCQTNYGVDNPSQSPEIKLKKKATSMTNFGVEHHLKDYDMLQKLFKSQHKVHRYKETILYYQGTYELFFLKLIEERRLLNEVSNGKSYEYNFESTKHTYHTDFHFHDTNIEIKSGWTYNKNGTDKKLEELNETKWKAVNDAGDAIIILKSKTEIQTFVNSLK